MVYHPEGNELAVSGEGGDGPNDLAQLQMDKIYIIGPTVNIDQATNKGALDVGQQLDSMRLALSREMNRELAPGVRLEGAVNDITIRGLFATQTSFVLRVVLDGEARAVMQ